MWRRLVILFVLLVVLTGIGFHLHWWLGVLGLAALASPFAALLLSAPVRARDSVKIDPATVCTQVARDQVPEWAADQLAAAEGSLLELGFVPVATIWHEVTHGPTFTVAYARWLVCPDERTWAAVQATRFHPVNGPAVDLPGLRFSTRLKDDRSVLTVGGSFARLIPPGPDLLLCHLPDVLDASHLHRVHRWRMEGHGVADRVEIPVEDGHRWLVQETLKDYERAVERGHFFRSPDGCYRLTWRAACRFGWSSVPPLVWFKRRRLKRRQQEVLREAGIS